MWGMLPHTAGRTVAMYVGEPVVHLRESLPDEAILPIEMGDGAAPVAPEFKHLGSVISHSESCGTHSMTTCVRDHHARIRLARIEFPKLHTTIFGTRIRDEAGFARIQEDSLRIAHTLASIVWLGMLGCKCGKAEAASAIPQESACGLCAESLVATLGNIASRPMH